MENNQYFSIGSMDSITFLFPNRKFCLPYCFYYVITIFSIGFCSLNTFFKLKHICSKSSKMTLLLIVRFISPTFYVVLLVCSGFGRLVTIYATLFIHQNIVKFALLCLCIAATLQTSDTDTNE